jgi:hypothetical protein
MMPTRVSGVKRSKRAREVGRAMVIGDFVGLLPK